MKKRIVSVDIMRGLSIFVMMLVNLNPNESLSYPFVVHTEWTGLTLADTAFPCFVFLAGVSAALTVQKLDQKNWLLLVLRRGIALILIGMIYNHFSNIFAWIFNPGYTTEIFVNDLVQHFRPFGVLQRIGFGYIFASIIFHYIREPKKILVAAFAILLISSLGYHLYYPADSFSQTNNISIAVDQLLQGSSHNHMQKIFDPEGLYGNINAIAHVLLGVVAGILIKQKKQMRCVVIGLLCAFIGAIWTFFDVISKPLWTTPYVLILCGIFMIILSGLDYLTDCSNKTKKIFFPAIVFGTSSLTIYLLQGLAESALNAIKMGDISLYEYIFRHIFTNVNNVQLAYLCLSLMAIVLLWLIMLAIYCIKNNSSKKKAQLV